MIYLLAVLALVVGVVIGYLFQSYRSKAIGKSAELEAQRLIEDAKAQARETTLAARDEELQLREEAEADIKRMRANLQREEERLQKRRETIDRKVDQ